MVNLYFMLPSNEVIIESKMTLLVLGCYCFLKAYKTMINTLKKVKSFEVNTKRESLMIFNFNALCETEKKMTCFNEKSSRNRILMTAILLIYMYKS